MPLARGRLGALADVRFRASWLALVAIAGQIVIVSLLPQGDGGLHHAVHLATYGLIAAFLWANRHIAYLWLAALGGALNLVAITRQRRRHAGRSARRSRRPASTSRPATSPTRRRSRTRIWPSCGDVFAVPASWPVSNVFSVGDVVLVVAALLALHCLCGSRLALVRFAAPLAR